ncbi:MAG: T9SS type A sorting domain-containing protein [Bacteroidota bacterium]
MAFSSNQTITFDGTTTISGSGTVLFTNGLTLNSTKSITLSREVAIPTGKTGTINGIFDCGANIVSGAGGFTLASGATLKTASATGVAGSVTTSSKSFSSGANYEFNGATTGTFTTTPTAYTVNDLTINNASGVTLSQAFTVNGTLTMKSGSLALGGNTLSYTASGTLKYDGTGYSTTTDVEFPVSSGPASLNVNNADATNGLSLQGNRTLSGTLTIASGKTFNIPASTSLTVTGNTIINQTNGLVIKSAAGGTGSFICNGTVNSGTGTTKVERYIVGYTNPDDGWHLLACPLNSFDILTSTFKPTSGDDDLYYYDETQNLWINWLTEDFDFANNRGYLCSYKTTATKYFSGELNNTDRKIDNVSYTPLQGGGWHLIPNPFPCGITWNSAGMSASGYVSTASGKVLNGGRSYSDISDGGIIPAMNSFFMQVNNAANSITIPASFRTHSSTWLKNTGDELLMLTAQSIENTTYQETIIRFNDDATEGFDPQYDSPFLQGVPTVPRMYSLLPDNTELSLNTFPVLTTSRVVPLTFIKGAANTYSINVTKLENFPQETAISLEDTKTNITQDLRTNMVYTFSSSEGDNPKRFFVHFGAPNGVNETVGGNPVRIYSSGNTLYINGNNGNIIKGDIFVYNLMGQQMLQSKLSEGAMTKLSINAPIGYYLVKVITEKKATTAKVFIQ